MAGVLQRGSAKRGDRRSDRLCVQSL